MIKYQLTLNICIWKYVSYTYMPKSNDWLPSFHSWGNTSICKHSLQFPPWTWRTSTTSTGVGTKLFQKAPSFLLISHMQHRNDDPIPLTLHPYRQPNNPVTHPAQILCKLESLPHKKWRSGMCRLPVSKATKYHNALPLF